MSADDRVAATLSGIRRRFSNTNYATTTDSPRLLSAAMASAADVPRLLAAVEAALKAADSWDAQGLVLRAGVHGDCADELRAAITAALTGEEAGDGG